MALWSLPRTNPGNRLQYKRVNGPPTRWSCSPAGKQNYPSATCHACCWRGVTMEAVRTQQRELILGDSLSEFMRTLGIYSTSSRGHIRLRNQMKRLFNSHVQLVYKDESGETTVNSGSLLHGPKIAR